MNRAETRGALLSFYGAFARATERRWRRCTPGTPVSRTPSSSCTAADVGKMWIALTGRAKELSVEYQVEQATAGRGTVAWTARYRYGSRPVVNVIRSEIVFDGNGLIARQRRLRFPKWAARRSAPRRASRPVRLFSGAPSRERPRRASASPPKP